MGPKISGGAHECVGIEHVDDAGHGHEIVRSLFAAVVAAIIAVIAIVDIVVAIVAFAAAHMALAAIRAVAIAMIVAIIMLIAIAAPFALIAIAVAPDELVLMRVFLRAFRSILVILRRQRGENVVQIAHGMLIVLLFSLCRAVTATRLIEFELGAVMLLTLARILGALGFGKRKIQLVKQARVVIALANTTTRATDAILRALFVVDRIFRCIFIRCWRRGRCCWRRRRRNHCCGRKRRHRGAGLYRLGLLRPGLRLLGGGLGVILCTLPARCLCGGAPFVFLLRTVTPAGA